MVVDFFDSADTPVPDEAAMREKMADEAMMSKPLDGAGLAIVNQVFNERLSQEVNSAIQEALGAIENALMEV